MAEIKMENANRLSERLLIAVKMQHSLDDLLSQVEHYNLAELQSDLHDDDRKKAFWINIYNAFFQILRKIKQIEKSKIYTVKDINIAGKRFSLDDVEHGVLRKYRYKFSLGYLPNPFVSRLIKKLAVSKIDYRIHFALNCGAKSCPPIAFYSVDKLESQLEMATFAFLEGETDVLEDQKEIHITRLFQWFKGDFGGTKGIQSILKEKLKIDAQGYKLVYKEYSWEEDLDNYADSDFETDSI